MPKKSEQAGKCYAGTFCFLSERAYKFFEYRGSLHRNWGKKLDRPKHLGSTLILHYHTLLGPTIQVSRNGLTKLSILTPLITFPMPLYGSWLHAATTPYRPAYLPNRPLLYGLMAYGLRLTAIMLS